MGLRLTGLSNYLLFRRAIERRNSDLALNAEQLSTQKRINRPSDDPEGSRVVLSHQQALDKLTQYSSNLDVGERYLKQSETALMGVKDIFVRAKELAIQGKNGTLSQEGRTAIAAEIQQLQQQLQVLGNTEINGEYIFAGFKSDTVPFSLDASQPATDPVATYAGDTNVRRIQISENSNLAIQTRGDLVFQGDGTAATVDLFQTLADLEVALRAGNIDDTDADSVGSQLDHLDTGFNQIVNEITSIGASQNRIESTKDYIIGQRESLTAFISSVQDADIAQSAFEYQRSSLALQATIDAAGNILKLPSLMDFLN